MRRLKMAGLAVAAASLFAVVGVATASAVTLPEFTVEGSSTGKAETMKTNLTGAAYTCTSSTENWVATSKQLFKGLIWCLGATLKGEECHTLGDSAGNLLWGMEGTEAEMHLVRLKSGNAGMWYLIPPTHIECKFEALLIVLQGNILGSITPILSDTTLFEVKVNVVAGKQEITEFENDAGEKVKAKLEGSINGGAFKAETNEVANRKLSWSRLTEIVRTT